jgi:hypothetical protein
MFDAGLAIFDVQRRPGHHSPVLTQGIYTHLMRVRYDDGRQMMETYIQRFLAVMLVSNLPLQHGRATAFTNVIIFDVGRHGASVVEGCQTRS